MFEFFERAGIPHGDRLSDLTPKMLGELGDYEDNETNPHPGQPPKTKAYETWILLQFAVDLLKKHNADIPFGTDLRVAGECMIEYMNILKDEGLVVAESKLQALFDLMVATLARCETAQVHFTPKFHFAVHAAQRTTPRDVEMNAVRLVHSRIPWCLEDGW
eukprot:9475488-Pyramimonas_sp.AAC.1